MFIRRVISVDNKELQHKTLGKPTQVALDAQKQTKIILSIKQAIEMKVELDLSKRQLFSVLKYMIWSMCTFVTLKVSTHLLD